ncbi:TPA: chitinase, partial [Listeria monocytogenes]
KDPQIVKNVFTRLQAKGTPVKGIMTWSVNWDAGKNKAGVPYNNGFSNAYGPIVGTK